MFGFFRIFVIWLVGSDLNCCGCWFFGWFYIVRMSVVLLGCEDNNVMGMEKCYLLVVIGLEEGRIYVCLLWI